MTETLVSSVNNNYMKNYYQTNKSYFKEYFANRVKTFNEIWRSGKCSECDTTEKLCWHHVDPETKEFTINFSRCHNMSADQIRDEIKKCVLMCRHCHQSLHHDKGLNSERKYIKDSNGNIVNQSREYFRQYYLNNKDK